MAQNRSLLSYETEEEQQLAQDIAQNLYRYDQIEQNRLSTVDDLNEERVAQFWREGYLTLDHLLNEEEIQQSIGALMDIVYNRKDTGKVQFVKSTEHLHSEIEREYAARKVYNYVDNDPLLTKIAYHPDILKIAKAIYQEDAKVVQDMAILKPPSGGAEKPWHQDMAYGPLTFDRPVIGFWIALDEATLDNGCMHVLPGSHMEGGVPHYAIRDWQLCDRNVQVHKDVAVPLKPGGVLIFHGMLHHGTPPNFSDKRRRALQLHYAPQSAEKISRQEYKRIFTNEMTGAEC